MRHLDRPKLILAGAFGLLLVVMFVVRSHYYVPGKGYLRVPAFTISGDEPHYLMVVNSILLDGDLNLAEDYRRVRNGGTEAGIRFRGVNLDHHTFLVDDAASLAVYWQKVYEPFSPVPCPPGDPGCMGFRRTSHGFLMTPQVREAAAHPIMFPALLAATIAPRFPAPGDIETYASDTIIIFCWLGVVFTYLLARRAGVTRSNAGFAAALLVASPWLAYSRSYFAEIAIGLAILLAVFALRAGRLKWAALAVGFATCMKPAFVIFGFVWAAERFWSGQRREAIRMAALVAVGGAVAGLINLAGAATPFVPPLGTQQQGSPFEGLWQTFLGEQRGFLRFAPWAAVSFIAARWMASRGEQVPGALTRQLLLPVVPYAWMIASSTAPWFGGNCYGPRYYVCVMPLLAVAAGLVFQAGGRALRTTCIVLGIIAATISIPGWIQYAMLWDKPASAAWRAFSSPT